MMKALAVAVAAILATTAVAEGQGAASRAPRFGAALGLITPGAMLPETVTGSISAVLVRREGNPFQVQVDATSFFRDPYGSTATASVVYHRPMRGIVAYGLAGAGLSNLAHHPRIVTGGVGTSFSYAGRALFTELRVYYPRQDVLSGVRIGIRF